jgi:hypothetical protein
MIPVPRLKVERFAQLEPGELFLFEHSSVRCVGFVCDYRDPDPTKLLLVLGPEYPGEIKSPTLLNINVTAISFGKEFSIVLPVDRHQWCEDEPRHDHHCLLVTNAGIFFRADGAISPHQGFVSCFVNAATGIVEVINSPSPGTYARPRGTAAYALSWEIITTESEPRSILKYPFASA